MKVEGFRKVFFETFVEKIGFLNVNIKRVPWVNKTFPQLLINCIFQHLSKTFRNPKFDCKNRISKL